MEDAAELTLPATTTRVLELRTQFQSLHEECTMLYFRLEAGVGHINVPRSCLESRCSMTLLLAPVNDSNLPDAVFCR